MRKSDALRNAAALVLASFVASCESTDRGGSSGLGSLVGMVAATALGAYVISEGADPSAVTSVISNAMMADASTPSVDEPSLSAPAAADNSQYAGLTSADCPPIDACESVQRKGEAFLRSLPSTAGITDSGSQEYCAMAVGVEVANYCASVYAGAGLPNCAAALRAQATEYQRVGDSAAATAGLTSTTARRAACDWEL